MTIEARDRKIKPSVKDPRPFGVGVVGVGGGGGNIVSYLCKQGIDNVDFYAINTDRQALDILHRDLETIQIGDRICDGEGAGGDPEVGRSAAQENTQLLMSKFSEKRLLFIIACMGGGTGTGASPVIADYATHENSGLLTVAIVTTPHGGEGDQSVALADQGLRALRSQVDAMMVVPNDKEGVGMRARHREINKLIFEKINAIASLLVDTQIPNIDMSDLKATLSQSNGNAVDMFIGTASLEPDEFRGDEVPSGDSQARFTSLLDQALATDWLTIDFDEPIAEGRGVLSFTLGGEEDDDEIDDITDESSIKRIVENVQTGASRHKLKIGSYLDSNLPKGALQATIVLRAAHPSEAASNETLSAIESNQDDELDDDIDEFDPGALPTAKQIADLDEGADDFETHIEEQDQGVSYSKPLDFSSNEEGRTELTRKNPS